MKPYYYDTIIGSGIVTGITGWLLFLLTIPFLSLLFLVGVIILMWGSFIEPKIITIKQVSVKLTKATQKLSIAVLTDLHAGPYKKNNFFERVVEKTIALDPDLIVVVGDHTFNCIPDEHEVEYLTSLKKLTEKYPVYAVHGNHEYGVSDYVPTNPKQKKFADVSELVKKTLESYGITYLVNKKVDLEINGQKLCLFGGDEVWTGNLDYSSLKEVDSTLPIIALVHNPAYLYHPHPQGIDLTIGGHTHGGQFRLPLIGPLGTVDHLIEKKLYQGLHEPERKGEFLFVSRGLGESEPRARLFCPPEIVLLTMSN